MNIIHAGVFCSRCNHPIIGARFYCVHCEKEFNLCEPVCVIKETRVEEDAEWRLGRDKK
jgi:hypothetical protein